MVHWSTVGKADATDSEIMAFAAANDYVVLTNDLDFAAILASTHHKKPSVVQIRTEDWQATHTVRLYAGARSTVEFDAKRDSTSGDAAAFVSVSRYMLNCGSGTGCPLP